MTAKFTKGPWVAICPEQRLLVGENKEHDITSYEVMSAKTRGELTDEGATHYRKDVHNVDNISVAHAYWRDMSDDEAKANAALIACAPEMYEQNEEYISILKALLADGYIGYADKLQKALEVSKKARGEA
jgi:lipoate synthase